MQELENQDCTMMPTPRPFLSRKFRSTLYWLFPPNFDKWPDTMEGKHIVSVTTDIFLDWKDRIRVLFGGVLRLDAITRSTGEPTEFQPHGPMDTVTAIEIRPPFITKRPE